MRTLFWLTALFVLAGCGGASRQYLLTIDTAPSPLKNSKRQIGVDTITVPAYLEESRIAIRGKGQEITYRDAVWAVPASKALTQSLITSLQKRFANPNVRLYPWDIERDTGLRIKVVIGHFIYRKGVITLDASYSIGPMGSKYPHSHLYTAHVASANDTVSVVAAMSKAFGKLTEDITQKAAARMK